MMVMMLTVAAAVIVMLGQAPAKVEGTNRGMLWCVIMLVLLAMASPAASPSDSDGEGDE
jgi:hypothetical protein